MIFLVICRWQWCFQKEVNFANKASPPSYTFPEKKIREVAKAYEGRRTYSRKNEEIHVGWTPPPMDWCKLNTDGVVKNNPGFASCGGVLRDCCGRWIMGLGHYLGIATVTEAKIWGLYNGLQLA